MTSKKANSALSQWSGLRASPKALPSPPFAYRGRQQNAIIYHRYPLRHERRLRVYGADDSH
jgi:hypothetical protein